MKPRPYLDQSCTQTLAVAAAAAAADAGLTGVAERVVVSMVAAGNRYWVVPGIRNRSAPWSEEPIPNHLGIGVVSAGTVDLAFDRAYVLASVLASVPASVPASGGTGTEDRTLELVSGVHRDRK